MSEQLLKEIQHSITVTMSGNSMEDTIGKIFSMMRKQVFSDIGYPIIQMDATEVYFEDIVVKEKKEKFLFFFMPRVKRYFTVTAKIMLTVKYLDYDKEEN